MESADINDLQANSQKNTVYEPIGSRTRTISSLTQGMVDISQYQLAMGNKLKPSTIVSRGKALRAVNKAVNAYHPTANILNFPAVTGWLADSQLTPNRKYKLVQDLKSFYGWKKIVWDPPRVRRERTNPFLPSLADIVLLITSIQNVKLQVFLQLLKETAMRCGEAWMLRWADINFKNRLVSVQFPEKGSHGRTLSVSQRLIGMLNHLSRKHAFLFHAPYDDKESCLKGLDGLRRNFERERARIAELYPDNQIGKIHFHSFRTWRATMEYLRTQDLEAVMALLGATNPMHARRYVRLARAIQLREDEYVTARATTPDEVEELASAGFTLVSEIQGVQIFRKEKWLVEEPFKFQHETRS